MGKNELPFKRFSGLTSPLDFDAGDELVSAESQSVTGDHSYVHLWTEENVPDFLTLLSVLTS